MVRGVYHLYMVTAIDQPMKEAKTMGSSVKFVLEIIDTTGHSEVQWDPEDLDEVAQAKQVFDDALKKGYAAFRMNDDGSTGEQIRSFDPHAARILMRPPLVGG